MNIFAWSLQWRPMDIKTSQFTCLLSVIQQFVKAGIQTSKFYVTGPLWGEPPVTDGFPSQRASNVKSVSTSWRHDYSG